MPRLPLSPAFVADGGDDRLGAASPLPGLCAANNGGGDDRAHPAHGSEDIGACEDTIFGDGIDR